MSEENDRPDPSDTGAEHSANASEGGEEGALGTQKADGLSQAGINLASLNEALGRKFENAEEAIKSLKNLNSLVGDTAIQELKAKAKNAPLVDKLVRKLAEEKGISKEDALAQLTSEAEKASGLPPEVDEKYRELSSEVTRLKVQAEEKDLLAIHPAAIHAMKELKTLASATGQSLKDAYESSNMKTFAEAAAESKERNDRGTGVMPSSRNALPKGEVSKAAEAYKKDPTGDNADRMVAAALGESI